MRELLCFAIINDEDEYSVQDPSPSALSGSRFADNIRLAFPSHSLASPHYGDTFINQDAEERRSSFPNTLNFGKPTSAPPIGPLTEAGQTLSEHGHSSSFTQRKLYHHKPAQPISEGGSLVIAHGGDDAELVYQGSILPSPTSLDGPRSNTLHPLRALVRPNPPSNTSTWTATRPRAPTPRSVKGREAC
jgi:hypothetical protein